MSKVLKIINLVLIFSLIFTTLSLAKENSLEDISKSIRQNINILNQDLSAKQNLQLRIEILKQTLELSSIQTSQIKQRLEKLDNLNQQELKYCRELNQQFSEFLNFYQQQIQSLNNLASIKQVREKANFIKQWRNQIYLPEFKQAINFLFLIKAKSIISMAENRNFKIKQYLNKIHLKKTKELKHLLLQVDSHLAKAKQVMKKAEQAFWNKTPNASIKNLIIESIKKVSLVYKIFYQIIKKT